MTAKTITFDQKGDFSAIGAARNWCQENGYSCGSMCRNLPIGLLKGDWVIAKWRNLTKKEISQLNGRITSADFREGPVSVIIDNDVELKKKEQNHD